MALIRVTTLLGMWAVSGTLLCWGHLPPRLRRALALLVSATGLAFLVLALNTAGMREEETTAGYLIGGPALVTGRASASASLPYYVMTGLCLLLGTVGLALPEAAARALRRRWLLSAIGLSIGVTLVRLLLERAAAPPDLAWAFGITGLAPLVGGLFAVHTRGGRRPWRELVRALAVYALAVRGWVALLYTAATLAAIGSTHYDVSRVVRAHSPLGATEYAFSPGSLWQVVTLIWVPQLAVWPLYTVVAGLAGAALARLLFMAGPRPEGKAQRPPVEMSPVGQD